MFSIYLDLNCFKSWIIKLSKKSVIPLRAMDQIKKFPLFDSDDFRPNLCHGHTTDTKSTVNSKDGFATKRQEIDKYKFLEHIRTTF